MEPQRGKEAKETNIFKNRTSATENRRDRIVARRCDGSGRENCRESKARQEWIVAPGDGSGSEGARGHNVVETPTVANAAEKGQKRSNRKGAKQAKETNIFKNRTSETENRRDRIVARRCDGSGRENCRETKARQEWIVAPGDGSGSEGARGHSVGQTPTVASGARKAGKGRSKERQKTP